MSVEGGREEGELGGGVSEVSIYVCREVGRGGGRISLNPLLQHMYI